MKKSILAIFALFVYPVGLSVLVIAQNSHQSEQPSATWEKEVDESRKRVDEKKKELLKRNVDVNSVTPTEIEELLDSNVLTIDDVENLFPEEKLKKLRVSKVLSTDNDSEMPLSMPFIIGDALYELRYYVGELPSGKITPKLKDAIKDFQRCLGNDPTGELLFGEFMELMQSYDKLSPTRVSLPSYRFFNSAEHSVGPGYVSLRGTWVFKDGTPQADPIQTSVIELYKNTMQGTERMAFLNYTGDSVVEALLTTYMVRWKITKWDSEEIVAENDAPINASYTLKVDMQNEKVYMYRSPKGKVFKKFELEPSILELVDGLKVSGDFYKKSQEEANKLYSPKYRSTLQQLSHTVRKDNIKANPVFAAEEIVFTGIPRIKIFIENGSQGTPEKLSQAESTEYKCTITKLDNKYYWTTRENVELIRHKSGAYTTFVATNGAGYVRIIDPGTKEILFKEGRQPYDYMEHLLLGLSTISYYGTSK